MNRTHKAVLSATLVGLMAMSGGASAQRQTQSKGDWFVILASSTSHDEAQAKAVLADAWVLDTDAYPNLTPNLYAAVRGPFSNAADAEQVLKLVREAHRMPTSKTPAYPGCLSTWDPPT